MALSPNPLTWTFPGALRNYQYGPELHHTVNYYPNPTRITGGNPWILFAHGGGLGSGDKTYQVEGVTRIHIVAAYFLDSASYGTSACFDFFSMEYNCHAHADTVQSDYETTLEGVAPGSTGTGPVSYPAYARSWVDDMQRCVQWIKDHITGIDPNKGVLFGNSAGGVIAATAGIGPQREWSSVPFDQWTAQSPSNVRGVLLYQTPIEINPWKSSVFEMNGHLGLLTSDNLTSRADYERALLEPDATGLYPDTVEPNALCKSFSPVHVVAAHGHETASVPIHSVYNVFEVTSAPVTTYSAIPPLIAHDYTQGATFQAACDDAGITHTYEIVAGVTQAQFEAILPTMYARSAAWVA